MSTTSDNAAAWCWVLEHSRVARAAAYRMAVGSQMDADDLHSSLLVRMVEKWHTYDPSRSAPSTWIWWQARAVRTAMVDQRRRRLAEVPIEDASVAWVPATAEARVLMVQARAIATPDEWTAAVAMAEGYDGDELGEVCQCASFSARRRVRRLRDRLSEDASWTN
jgi:DNA-directed RNA polymerase specialized sigma24 family protein